MGRTSGGVCRRSVGNSHLPPLERRDLWLDFWPSRRPSCMSHAGLWVSMKLYVYVIKSICHCQFANIHVCSDSSRGRCRSEVRTVDFLRNLATDSTQRFLRVWAEARPSRPEPSVRVRPDRRFQFFWAWPNWPKGLGWSIMMHQLQGNRRTRRLVSSCLRETGFTRWPADSAPAIRHLYDRHMAR